MAFDPNDANWYLFTSDKINALRIAPNQLWANTRTRAGALVVMKSSKYDEYALSKAGLDYLMAAHQEQRISDGEVVLARWGHNGKLTVVAAKPVATVAAALTNIPPRAPREGGLGPYWWIRDDLTPDVARVLSAEEPALISALN